jgi:hypothetical protein
VGCTRLLAGCAENAHLQPPPRGADLLFTATAAGEDAIMFLHFLLLAVVGVILLGTVRDRPWLRGFAIAVTGALALGASIAVFSLFALGRQMRWTSDGPGILGVVLALILCGTFMLLAWNGVWRQLRTPRGGPGTLRTGLALLVVGVLGAAVSGEQQRRAGKPSHDVEVVGLAFDDASDVLYSLDHAGTLKAWDAATGAAERTWVEPALAGATRLEIAPGGRRALVTGAGDARILDLDGADAKLVVSVLPGVHLATFVRDDRLALARDAQLEIVGLRAGEAPLQEISFDARIDALASAGGTLAVATSDATVTLLDSDGEPVGPRVALAAPVRRLSVSPEGVRVVAVTAEQQAWVIARDAAIAEAPRWMGFGHVGFLGDALLVAARDGMPEILALRLPALETSPFLNHGIGVTALAASPSRRRVAVAFGANLHLTGALGADPRAVVASRLTDPRL